MNSISISFLASRHYAVILLSLFSWAVVSCSSSTNLSPKPKGYNRIELPHPVYQQLPDTLPYNFSYSAFANVTNDSSWIAEPYWIDLTYPELTATIQVSYKPVKQNKQLLKEYIKDSYDLTSKHNVKAYAIDEAIVELNNGLTATILELSGEVPSQLQFHVTDSSTHFLRGALYFRTATKNDSLAPVINYVKRDIMHMLNTLEWNKNMN